MIGESDIETTVASNTIISPAKSASTGAITRAIIDISFIMMFSDGPAVSFIGSPTVSPTTAAL